MAARPDPADRVTPPASHRRVRPARPRRRSASRASPTAPPACSCSATRCSTGGSPGPRAGSAATAPCPVVELVDSRSACGGAANTAANLAALGATVDLLAVFGDDAEAAHPARLCSPTPACAPTGASSSWAARRP